ncbi:MAG TPA: hypothetical protein VMW52_04450 [Phycisphaerae bacterium]|nr:hypothetical protein [Phycisphaerae bacterium]
MIRHVQPGAPFDPSAREWNAFVDAANADARGGRRRRHALPPRPARALVVWVRNGSGSNRSRGDILGLGGSPVWDPADADEREAFRSQPCLAGRYPTEPADLGRFGVCLGPIAEGAVGDCLVAGLAAVTLDVDDEDAADFADCADGITAYLLAGPTGSARVLWREGGTGQQWAYVLLGAGLPLSPSDTEYHVLQTQAAGEVLRVAWDFARLHDD